MCSIACFAVLLCAQKTPVPRVTVAEAFASLRYTLQAVGVKGSIHPKSLRLENFANWFYDTKTGKPLSEKRHVAMYMIRFKIQNDSREFSSRIDAVSGDVHEIGVFPYSPSEFSPVLTRGLLSAIGRSADFVPSSVNSSMTLVVDGKPIFLEANRFVAAVQANNGKFASLHVGGAAPPKANGAPSVTQQEALRVCAKEYAAKFAVFSRKLKATMGFYFNGHVLCPIWQVQEVLKDAGKNPVGMAHYVDAYTGKIRNSWDLDHYEPMYLSRKARCALKNVPSAFYDSTPIQPVQRLLSEFGHKNWIIDTVVWNTGIRAMGKSPLGEPCMIQLTADRRLDEFRAEGMNTSLSADKALEIGTALIRKHARALPEGRFVNSTLEGRRYRGAKFIQTAYGYDCYPYPVVLAQFSGSGQLARYRRTKPMTVRSKPPSALLSKQRIEELAKTIAVRHFRSGPSSSNLSATATVKRIGWFVPKGSSTPMLCYDVQIRQYTHSSQGTRGGGRDYLFDAASGKIQEPYP